MYKRQSLFPACTWGQALPVPAQETRPATRGSLKCARGGISKRRSTPTASAARGEVPGRRSTSTPVVAARRGGIPGRTGRTNRAADGFSSSTTAGERYGRGRELSPGRTGRVNGVGGSIGCITVEGRHGLSVEGRKPGFRGSRSTKQSVTSSPRASTASGRNNAFARGASRRERNAFSAGNNSFSGERDEGNPWRTVGSGATALMPTSNRRPKLPEAKKLTR